MNLVWQLLHCINLCPILFSVWICSNSFFLKIAIIFLLLLLLTSTFKWLFKTVFKLKLFVGRQYYHPCVMPVFWFCIFVDMLQNGIPLISGATFDDDVIIRRGSHSKHSSHNRHSLFEFLPPKLGSSLRSLSPFRHRPSSFVEHVSTSSSKCSLLLILWFFT